MHLIHQLFISLLLHIAHRGQLTHLLVVPLPFLIAQCGQLPELSVQLAGKLQKRHRTHEIAFQAHPLSHIELVHGQTLQCVMHLEQPRKASTGCRQFIHMMG
ncbi:hypothetical protein D9M68_807360 [compost metagenome]